MTSESPKPLAMFLARLNKVCPAPFEVGSPEFEAALAAQREAARAAWEAEQEARAGAFLAECGVRTEQVDALLVQAGRLEENTARSAVRRFLAAPARVFLLLLGPVGSGKTVAACEAFLSQRSQFESPTLGRSWQWAAPGAFAKARHLATLSQFREGRAEFERICRAPLLVLDEVGSETASLRGALDDLVDERYSRHLRTIITSNLTAEQFKDERTGYGQRTVDRIRQRGDVVVCPEPSYRERRRP